MAVFTSPPTVVPGDTWTASNQNTYVKANFDALWVGTTRGDLDYYSASNQKARLALVSGGLLYGGALDPAWLAIGANGYHLESNGTAPTWVANTRYMTALLNTNVALTTGDDAFRFRIPSELNGWNIVGVAASRKSGTGLLTIQIRNVTDAVDVLSTKLTVDTGETDSSSAATAAVIDTTKDDVATGDQFAIDVDDAGTSTLYAYVEIAFRKP